VIIDWHTHVLPPTEAGKPMWKGRCPMTVDNVLAAQERARIDVSVISSPLHHLHRSAPGDALVAIRESNRYLADAQAGQGGRIISFASTLPCGGDAFLRELERAVTRDGLKGVFISSSHQGAYPDDPEAAPFFELVTRLDIPVFMHPPAVGFGEERMGRFRLASSVGRPFDTCLALARLILFGVLERFPRLKLVVSHLGGGICEVLGRLDYNFEFQEQGYYVREADSEPMLIAHPPSHYLRQIYFDTVSYHLPALRCAFDTMGADHLLFGSDAPPLTPLKARALTLIEELELSASDKTKVLSGNAARLLSLASDHAEIGETR
jgi:aminocarboxymuconate-semialdehyde decarboxylase